MAQLGAGLLTGEAPLDGRVLPVAVGLPGGDFAFECRPIPQPAIEALAAEDGELNLCHVEPTPVFGRVMEFQSAGDPPSFGGREGLVERGRGMRIEVVAYQSDHRG